MASQHSESSRATSNPIHPSSSPAVASEATDSVQSAPTSQSDLNTPQNLVNSQASSTSPAPHHSPLDHSIPGTPTNSNTQSTTALCGQRDLTPETNANSFRGWHSPFNFRAERDSWFAAAGLVIAVLGIPSFVYGVRSYQFSKWSIEKEFWEYCQAQKVNHAMIMLTVPVSTLK